jgi:hypothetical protein
MSIQRYYRWALLLPLLLPAITLPLTWWEVRLPDGIAVVVLVLFWSLLIGGIPYVLFAAGFLWWSRGRSDQEVRHAILLSPMIYAGVLMACTGAFLAVDTPSFWNHVDDMGTMGMLGVLFGYAYVIIAELGRVVLRPGQPAPVPQPAA